MKGLAALLSTLLLASLQNRHAMAAPNWTVKKDVSYGSDQQEKLDLYLLNKGSSNPLIILIHGGGWGAGDKSAEERNAASWATQGYHIAALNYRLAAFASPTDLNQWNAALQDVQLAVRFLRANAATFRIDGSRIGALGDSAGAQLALFLGTLSTPVGANPAYPAGVRSYVDVSGQIPGYSSKVQVVVDEFGPTKLTDPNMYANLQGLAVFGGRKIGDPGVMDVYWDASPIRVLSSQSAPTCIIQGTNDTVVPPSQSTQLRDKLASLHVPYKYISYAGDHEFSGLFSRQQNMLQAQAQQFVSNYLHPNPLSAR